VQAVKVLLLPMDKEAAALADPFAEDKITLHEQNLTGNKPRCRSSSSAYRLRVFVLLAVVFGTSMACTTSATQARWRAARRARRLHVHPAGQARRALRRRRPADARAPGWGHWMFGVSLGTSPVAMLPDVGVGSRSSPPACSSPGSPARESRRCRSACRS
jgi:hypothetical protein